jgi:hypothetical protein
MTATFRIIRMVSVKCSHDLFFNVVIQVIVFVDEELPESDSEGEDGDLRARMGAIASVPFNDLDEFSGS